MSGRELLLCWHSERAGLEVLENAVKALQRKPVRLEQIMYLTQQGSAHRLPERVQGVPLKVHALPLRDPTEHAAIYGQVRGLVRQELSLEDEVHVNVSPGTPAMHAAWLVLYAAGAFPPATTLWSSQFDPKTKRTRLAKVEFQLTTYLSQIRRAVAQAPSEAAYEVEAQSPARREFLERLSRYARVMGAPLLILGERGTGKTRLVETLVAVLKQRENVVTLACGGLDSTLADSLLFGHVQGAFTGATSNRHGLIKQADGGLLFLDEIQDLPATAQRKLVRVLQDRRRRYRALGSDKEQTADVELVGASNLTLEALRGRLDADLFDRLSHLQAAVPPLRECREDIQRDWQAVWSELTTDPRLPSAAPWSEELHRAFNESSLAGNFRDLQRMALLLAAWLPELHQDQAIQSAVDDWRRGERADEPDLPFGTGNRQQRIAQFQARLATWARDQWGTWTAAAKELECDEKTLRTDVAAGRDKQDGQRRPPPGGATRRHRGPR